MRYLWVVLLVVACGGDGAGPWSDPPGMISGMPLQTCYGADIDEPPTCCYYGEQCTIKVCATNDDNWELASSDCVGDVDADGSCQGPPGTVDSQPLLGCVRGEPLCCYYGEDIFSENLVILCQQAPCQEWTDGGQQ